MKPEEEVREPPMRFRDYQVAEELSRKEEIVEDERKVLSSSCGNFATFLQNPRIP